MTTRCPVDTYGRPACRDSGPDGFFGRFVYYMIVLFCWAFAFMTLGPVIVLLILAALDGISR